MYCIAADAEGVLHVTGTAPCAESSLVALTLSELQTETASPFRLSVAEGGAVAGAILGVWATAYAIRVLRHTLAAGEPER